MNQFPHILRPTTLKLRWASNFAKLPQNSRSISRTNLIIRLLVILIVIGAVFSFFAKQSKSSLFDEVNSLEKQLKNEPGNANLHLQMGFVWNKKFLQTNDKMDFEQAKQEVQIAQQLDPTNIFALKLARYLKQEDISDAQKQITETKKILEERPDYLEAWQKLAILYEQIGEETLAGEARNRAAQINSLTL